MKKIFDRIAVWSTLVLLLTVSGTLNSAEVRYDFNGTLKNAVTVGNAQLNSQKEVIVSDKGRLEIKSNNTLQSQSGTLEIAIRSIDWAGSDNTHKYFFYSRKKNGKDVIFLRKDANGDLVFAMGRLPRSLDQLNASAAFWQQGSAHTVKAVWDADTVELYVDDNKVASRNRSITGLQWSDPVWIGGTVWSPASGASAIDHLTISTAALRPAKQAQKPAPAKRRIVSLEIPPDLKFTPIGNNICSPEYQAVILPGSQHKPDRSKAVEMLYDKQVSTYYRSDKDAQVGDRFLEIRWPSAVAVKGVKLLPHPALAPESYKLFYRNKAGKWTLLAQQNKPAEYTAFDEIFTEELRFEFLLPDNANEFGLLELEVAGSGPRKYLKEQHWSGNYLWPLPDENGNNPTVAGFRRTFRVDDPEKLTKAFFQLSADDAWDLYLNGEKISTGGFAVTCFDFKRH